jgi:hypothetical protein
MHILDQIFTFFYTFYSLNLQGAMALPRLAAATPLIARRESRVVGLVA